MEFFSKYGFSIEKIPTSNEESPEFLVIDGNCKILVELKTKFDDKELLASQKAVLKKGIYLSIFQLLAEIMPRLIVC